MKKFLTSIISILIIILLVNFISCTNENEEDLLNNDSDIGDTNMVNVCDTMNLTYDSVATIFAVCVSCHNSESTYREGVVMDSYVNVKNSIQTQPVWEAINHEDGYIPMPRYNPKLEQCELDKIGAWINDSMPE